MLDAETVAELEPVATVAAARCRIAVSPSYRPPRIQRGSRPLGFFVLDASSARPATSNNLDLIRAFAVLCVVLHHLLNAAGRGSDFTWLVGHMGVIIFFVHTSTVLMLSLEQSVHRLSGLSLVVDFCIRRVFRIYPLAMLCVVVTFVGLVPSRPEPWPWSTFVSNLALTMNLTYSQPMWSVLWTLPLELQMYLILPSVFLWLRSRTWVWTLVAWCLAAVAATTYTYVSSRLSVAAYAPCFFGGVLAWRLRSTVKPCWKGEWWPAAFAASWVVFLVADRRDPEYFRWAFCLTLGCLLPRFKDLTWSPIVKLAHTISKYSYGIYLSHLPIILFAFSFEGVERVLVLAVLAVLVPFVMYHAIERPMIAVGRRVAGRVTAQRSQRAIMPPTLGAQPQASRDISSVMPVL